MADLAVIILTYNEHLHLARALHSVRAIAKEIFVVDSFSTDDTAQIAESFGAVVLQHPFVNQAKQFQWALENVPIKSEWVMRLDADEVVGTDLQAEIERRLPLVPAEVTGVNLKRKLVFMDRVIRYGGRGTLILLRIWRRGFANIEDRWMDEHISVRSGGVLTFEGEFTDHNLNDLTFFVEKHNRYATREAIELLNQHLRFMPAPSSLLIERSSFQAAAKRYIKQRIYNRIPFPISSFGYFLYRYVLLLGFLDGKAGLIYSVLQGFWYRFLVGAKVDELRRSVEHLTDSAEVAREVQRLTGLTLLGKRERGFIN
ncbi:glycosyltransferase family 2 protein [Bradyrhizobium sp. ERR14]|uniref:glycosyltransferase family 2 protein n=1 Tax=Bradyrhizobium sp. ERR14 TaxID=2663837 RepID=UPI0017B51765|nr:glycosyltransferase family 2 protein [Bradyrhizobium sp. ERR14]MBB4396211.1 glycosyltransferase involved in cell wall biosynthesis [Bradyrhizobium sp. ERR14]